MKNALDYAIREGREEGKLEGKLETIERMLAEGFDWPTIQRITLVDQVQYESLRGHN